MASLMFAEAGLSWTALSVIVGAVLGVGALLGTILLQHGSKLSAIKTAVEHLQRRSDEQRDDVKHVWTKLNDFAHRITVLESKSRAEP